MIIIRRCSGFTLGRPRPHRRYVRRDRYGEQYTYGTDLGYNARYAWRWYCDDNILHRMGLNGGAASREECQELADAHWMKYHVDVVRTRTTINIYT